MPRPKLKLTSFTRRMMVKRVLRLVYKKMPKLEGKAPSNPKEKEVDDLLEFIFFSFDLSPILSGDRLQARLVAVDLIREVMDRARSEAERPDTLFTEEDVIARWKDVVDDQVNSLLAFQRLLATRVAAE